MCCLLVFEFSVGIGGVVIGLDQISFFSPTDRPMSVRNRCVIEAFVAFCCCQLVFFFVIDFDRSHSYRSGFPV